MGSWLLRQLKCSGGGGVLHRLTWASYVLLLSAQQSSVSHTSLSSVQNYLEWSSVMQLARKVHAYLLASDFHCPERTGR